MARTRVHRRAKEPSIKTPSSQPGQFDLLDPAVIQDPYPFYRALLREAPVYQVPGTEVFLVSSWQLVHEVLANQEDYSANLTGVLIRGDDGVPALFDLSVFGGTVDAIANADEPSHAVHRRLVMPQLTARKVARLEEEVLAWARRGTAALLASGGGDCIDELANRIPVMVTARLIGLPLDDTDRLLGWAFSGGELLAGIHTLEEIAALGAQTGEMGAYLTGYLEKALAAEAVAAPDNILEELARGVRDGAISEREAVGILVVLVGAAGESTSSLIGSAIRLLAQDADLQARLRADPELLPAYIEEVVRLESPFKGHYRAPKVDTRVGGVSIPASGRVFLLWAAANRDPAVFDNPDALDIDRTDGGDHLGFGHGIHFCIGARLARMEARIVLATLLGETRSIALSPDEAPVHLESIFVRRLPRLAIDVVPARS